MPSICFVTVYSFLINPFEGAHRVLHTFSSLKHSGSFFSVSSFFITALEFKD